MTESPSGGSLAAPSGGSFVASPEGDHPHDHAASAREIERLRRELQKKHDELLTAARLGKGLLEREEKLKQALAGERSQAAATRGELEAVWQRNAELRQQLTTLQSANLDVHSALEDALDDDAAWEALLAQLHVASVRLARPVSAALR